MGASARLLHYPLLNRPLITNLTSRSRNPNPRNALNLSFPRRHLPLRSAPFSTASHLISASSVPSPPAYQKDGAFHVWDRPLGVEDGGGGGGRGAAAGAGWTVVLLGWLGAEHRHLKRYAEMYNERGLRSVRFVVPVGELWGIDMGRRVEERIRRLAQELASWCSEAEEDGRERRLMFHMFSNTGWLAYGAILENWQLRSDITKKIGGCVIDSAPAPELSPQVWAAGFCAALLKKRSSLIYSSVESNEVDKLNGINNRPGMPGNRFSLTETIVLSILEKFFYVVLNLPDVNQRLSRILSTLSKNQPPCPQLYLYSSADKVVPVCSVERFIKEQKSLGIPVYSHDFGTSPHVDHFRSFPRIYSDKVNDFLKECLSPVSSTM